MDLKEKFQQAKGFTEDKILPTLVAGKEKVDQGFDVAEKFVTQTICRQKETDIDSLLDRLADNLWARFKEWKNADSRGKGRS
jgi:hypothetical protein